MLELTERKQELLEMVVQHYIHLDWQVKQGIRQHAPPLNDNDVMDLRELYDNKLWKDE